MLFTSAFLALPTFDKHVFGEPRAGQRGGMNEEDEANPLFTSNLLHLDVDRVCDHWWRPLKSGC